MAAGKNAVKIVINADDLGAGPLVNQAVERLMRAGRVTSATILANSPLVEDAAALAQSLPGRSFGVHLNLTEGRPLTDPRGLAAILDGEGRFARARAERPQPPAVLRAMYREWEAQVRRVRSLGVEVSHLDSHHHLHTRPWMLPLVMLLMRRSGIRRVRLSKNLYHGEHVSRGKLLAKAAFNQMLKLPPGVRATRWFTEILTFRDAAREMTPPPGSLELMTHPGPARYLAEEEALWAGFWESLPFAVELVSYHGI